MRLKSTWHDWNPRSFPLPRPVWVFEENWVQVGVQLTGRFEEAIASFSIELELTDREVDRLVRLILWGGAQVCRIRGHRIEQVAIQNEDRHGLVYDHEQCVRCWAPETLKKIEETT